MEQGQTTNRVLRVDAMQGASEERTELYWNTAKEYRSWQRRSAPQMLSVLPALRAGRTA